ncbi:MAG: hypothetical protein JG781_2747, partial [Peptococcaceae bacterium]|nr:hypothetical protein [Peptococcaceae bacterium]
GIHNRNVVKATFFAFVEQRGFSVFNKELVTIFQIWYIT